MRSNLHLINLLTLIFLFIQQQTYAQDQMLFGQDKMLHISIYADMDALLNDIGEEREYHNGILVYNGPQGQMLKFDIELRIRGNFRRRADICPFPPIKINFEKDQIKNTSSKVPIKSNW
ncbi:MAG: hypothetical protein U5Q03_03240 [Bacteroidota bacterium]|nr:hypothetical protein [Bacteroidota bacterium]